MSGLRHLVCALSCALLGGLVGEAWERLLGVPRSQRASTLYGWTGRRL